MRTLTEKYNGVLKGTYTKDQFIREARMQFPNLITQHNSYQDATRILLNKGIITEVMSDQGKEKIIKSATQNGDKSYSVTYEDGTTAKIAVSHDDWDEIHGKYGSLSEEEVVEGMYKKALKKAQIQEETNIKYMDSASTLLQALKPTFHNAEIVFAGRNNDLARVTYHTENPGGEGITTVNCGETSISSMKPFFYQEVDEIGDTNTVAFDTIEELIQYCKSGEEMFEKKLTPAEKKGKEKIVKSIAKGGMSKKDPKTYAIATAKAKELYEGPEDINNAYDDILELVKKHARSLNDDDAYQLHEQLKSFFNRLLESDQQSEPLQVGDVIDHKGVQKKVVRIDGHRVFLQPVDSTGGNIEIDRKLGIERDFEMRGKTLGEGQTVSREAQMLHAMLKTGQDTTQYFIDDNNIDAAKLIDYIRNNPDEKYNVINYILRTPGTVGAEENLFQSFIRKIQKSVRESKEAGYKAPKAELPLDVLHHGIRFELDKKGIGNTPNQEEYLKAYKLASKNITKDLLFYKKEEGAEQLPDNPTDQMTKVKLKEGIKEIIKKLLSEDVSKVKKPFNIKGQLL
jgi:hypothetical protein